MNPKIIKTGICKSSSGQSTLTYNIAKVGSDIQFQIEANTGTGLFSKEWISLKDIQGAITSSITLTYSDFDADSSNKVEVLYSDGINVQSTIWFVTRGEPQAPNISVQPSQAMISSPSTEIIFNIENLY